MGLTRLHWTADLSSGIAMTYSRAIGVQATPLLDKYIFSTFRSAFGGRVRFIVSGGAPLSTHVEEYLTTALCTPVFQVTHPSAASDLSVCVRQWCLQHPACPASAVLNATLGMGWVSHR